MWETDGSLKGRIEYSTDLFDPQTIVRLAGHFQTLLESAVSNPDASIDRLALIGAAEMQRQVVEWNRTARDYPRHETLHGLFRAQARRTPDAIAVVEDRRSITYAQLAWRAGDIGDRLAAAGVQPGSIVGIYLARSIDWIAAALGVLDAGAAYLPLDPSQPPRRIESVVADADVRYVVAARSLPLGSSGLTVIDVNASGSSGGCARVPTSISIDPRALAYVLYTSGSTGRPRGVMVEHRSLVNHAFAIRDRDALVETDRVLQFAPLGFDCSASTYYEWINKTPTRRQLRDAELVAIITAQREDKKTGKFVQTLGSRKLWIRLRGQGHDVARCTVERIMREQGWEGARYGSGAQDHDR